MKDLTTFGVMYEVNSVICKTPFVEKRREVILRRWAPFVQATKARKAAGSEKAKVFVDNRT